MNAMRSTAAALAVSVVWSSAVLAGPPVEAQKTAAPVTRPMSREQVQSRLKAMRLEETQRIASLEAGERTARAQSLEGQIQARRAAAASRALQDAAACKAAPQIYEVTPEVFMPGDAVTVTGCGFSGSRGMLLLSDGSQKMNVTAWTDTTVDATVPGVSGFAEPKSVTIKVATVEAGRSVSSKALTLKPTLVLKEIEPAGVDLQGCRKSWTGGIATHDYSGSFLAPGCSDVSGIDTVKFGVSLKGNWRVHSLVFEKVCAGGVKPCGADGDATPVPGGLQPGTSALPDLLVKWEKNVAYSPAVRVIGPHGTQPY